MKKVYTLFSVMLFAVLGAKAQDTLLYESFQFVMDSYLMEGAPPGNVEDEMWYNFDADELADGSGGTGERPGGWWQILPFADADSIDPLTMDTNLVMTANSWFTSPDQANNWLITQNIKLGDHDTLFWSSAPRQTPRYLDGYEVKLSTTTNDDFSFTHVLFTAAEMTGLSTIPGDSSNFANHTFSSGFVHGEDSTYIVFDTADPTGAYNGMLRPFWVALDPYANQNVFIAFHHNSFDDNLISIDHIMVRGTPSNPAAGIKEQNRNDLSLDVFPNPANEFAQLNFELPAETEVTITVSDVTGKVVYSENKGSQLAGRHFAKINTSSLAKGFYSIAVQTNNSRNTVKLIVK
ncbi:MAG: T9SS type A sorting domain-containing protein [Bacteroidia bacterium]|jgi:hypothetical protein